MAGDSTFGAWMRRRRRALDLTREELARRAGCSASAVRRMEADELRPSKQLAELLAAALELAQGDVAAFVRFARDAGDADIAAPVVEIARLGPESASGITRPNLPIPSTALIGRETEAAAVAQLLQRSDVRLVTLTGPGGTGKTRLALHIAAEQSGRFRDSVFFVDLAPLADPQFIVNAIAQAVGVRPQANRSLLDTLSDTLSGKPTLLLLDNFEQVVVGARDVSTLLAHAASLKVLVTSRVALQVGGEREYHLPPLPMPATLAATIGAGDRRTPATSEAERGEYARAIADNSSVRLFVERAKAVRHDFALSAENASTIAEICRRLDGLPLAIELVAARSRLLAPDAILARLGSRLALGTRGPRDAPARQQTLQNTIDWSYDLLDQADQRLFRRMGVFVGGCTLDAVEAVCVLGGDPPDALAGVERLLAHSLLQTAASEPAGAPRVAMLETIHEYALAKLIEQGEAKRFAEQHARFFCDLATRAEPKQRSAEQVAWLDWLERELGNVRAALTWSTSADSQVSRIDASPRTEVGMRLAAALHHFWLHHGYLTEGRDWLERLLASSAPTVPAIRSDALMVAGHLALFCGDHQRAAQFFEESVTLARQVGDPAALARGTHALSWVYRFRGAYARSVALLEESIALVRQLGDDHSLGLAFANLAYCTFEQGEFERTDALLEQGLAIFQRMDAPIGIQYTRMLQGKSAYCQGDLPRAAALLRASIAISYEVGEKNWRTRSLNYLGLAVYRQGDMLEATAIFHEALALAQEIGSGRELVETLYGLGRVATRTGELDQAVALLSESLSLAHAQGMQLFVAERLEALAAASMAVGQADRAARMLGAAEALRQAIGAPLPPVERQEHGACMSAARRQLSRGVFAAAWAAGHAMTTDQAVAYAREKSHPIA